MFRTKNYVPIIALTALAHTQAIRTKADSQWHLAMIPDNYDAGNSFISAPGQNMGFGFGDEPMSMFGSNFGSNDRHHFGEFEMPSFSSFPHLSDLMNQNPGAHGNSMMSSSSSSYSSAMGADGKKHEKSSKAGEQKACQDGKCKTMVCQDGKCQEMNEDANANQGQGNRVQENQDPAFRANLANQERQMEDSFSHMGERMKQMEQGFSNMERNMEERFRDMPTRMNDMFKNGNTGNEGHSQSYSSSFQESMGKDGKVHKKESKQGQDMECSNGVCKGTVCENGACHEVSYQAKKEPTEHKKK